MLCMTAYGLKECDGSFCDNCPLLKFDASKNTNEGDDTDVSND